MNGVSRKGSTREDSGVRSGIGILSTSILSLITSVMVSLGATTKAATLEVGGKKNGATMETLR